MPTSERLRLLARAESGAVVQLARAESGAVVQLARGERGAIMVMGIFMCSCLVGALWYLAGVGDAILLRERAQEAADAVAFSDAALHARGMNLIVLVNLVMACILGVRVALKIAKAILLAAAAVFGSLGYLWPPLFALAAPCMAAAQAVQTVIDATREPINQSLHALSLTQDGISTLTPAAARKGALVMVGDKYAPAVTRVGVAHVGSETSLPIASGSQDKLCKEAGHAAGWLSTWAIGKGGLGSVNGKASSWLGDKFAWLASTSPMYFCELGSATGDPDMSELFADSAEKRCANGNKDKEQRSLDDTEDAWQDKCREYGVTCTGRDEKGQPIDKGAQQGRASTPAEQAELDRLRLVRDQNARALREFKDAFGDDVDADDRAKCEKWAADDAKRRQREQNALAREQRQQQGDGDGENDVTPKKVDPDFRNGHGDAQVAGGALVDASRLRRSSRLVRVGAWDRSRKADRAPEGAELPSWAQAEFFYDCAGTWARCDEDEDAMWHLKWRPRLRRWNEPMALDAAIAEMGLAGSTRLDLARFADRARTKPVGAYSPNPALRDELDRALVATRRRGVH
ncbi:MAG: hypothetical protein KF764_07565 [Labilithrix sp.]|nr:hypothetical protein [Labilithrix sp.]